jgi:CheY-like chemotaxis protein
MHRNLTILVVEDDADDAFFLRRALSDEKILNPVQVVANGKEAIAYLLGEGAFADRMVYPFPSVIISDLKMPLFSGFDLLEWLQKHPECIVIPFIVLSSSKLDADVKKAYVLGANAYLVKPRSVAELRKILRTTHEFWAVCELPRVSLLDGPPGT